MKSKDPLELFRSLPGALSIKASYDPPGYNRNGEHGVWVAGGNQANFTDYNSAARFYAAFPEWEVNWQMHLFISIEVNPDWPRRETAVGPRELYRYLKLSGRCYDFDEANKKVQFCEFNAAATFKCAFPDWSVDYVYTCAQDMGDYEVDLEMSPYV